MEATRPHRKGQYRATVPPQNGTTLDLLNDGKTDDSRRSVTPRLNENKKLIHVGRSSRHRIVWLSPTPWALETVGVLQMKVISQRCDKAACV